MNHTNLPLIYITEPNEKYSYPVFIDRKHEAYSTINSSEATINSSEATIVGGIFDPTIPCSFKHDKFSVNDNIIDIPPTPNSSPLPSRSMITL